MGLIGSIAGFGAKSTVAAYRGIGYAGRGAVAGGIIGAGIGAATARPGEGWNNAAWGAGIGAVAGGGIGFGLVRPTANYLNFRKAMKGIGTTLKSNVAKNSARDPIRAAQEAAVNNILNAVETARSGSGMGGIARGAAQAVSEAASAARTGIRGLRGESTVATKSGVFGARVNPGSGGIMGEGRTVRSRSGIMGSSSPVSGEDIFGTSYKGTF